MQTREFLAETKNLSEERQIQLHVVVCPISGQVLILTSKSTGIIVRFTWNRSAEWPPSAGQMRGVRRGTEPVSFYLLVVLCLGFGVFISVVMGYLLLFGPGG